MYNCSQSEMANHTTPKYFSAHHCTISIIVHRVGMCGSKNSADDGVSVKSFLGLCSREPAGGN